MADFANLKATPKLDDFLRMYEADDNIWWAMNCGHHQNLFEEACDRIDELELALIEATNPGIDMDRVRRERAAERKA